MVLIPGALYKLKYNIEANLYPDKYSYTTVLKRGQILMFVSVEKYNNEYNFWRFIYNNDIINILFYRTAQAQHFFDEIELS